MISALSSDAPGTAVNPRLSYIFEANIYVENEENRYEVIDGLSKLRKTLSSMIEGE